LFEESGCGLSVLSPEGGAALEESVLDSSEVADSIGALSEAVLLWDSSEEADSTGETDSIGALSTGVLSIGALGVWAVSSAAKTDCVGAVKRTTVEKQRIAFAYLFFMSSFIFILGSSIIKGIFSEIL